MDVTQLLESSYNHHSATKTLEELKRQLAKNKAFLNKVSLQSHLLNVDLATQFNPYMVQSLKSVDDNCKKCSNTIQGHKEDMNTEQKPVVE